MFDSLTSRLSRTVDALRGRGRITEENVAEVLREVRVALLEADVALPVIKQFIDQVKVQALGTEVRLTQCCLDGHHCCEFEASELQPQAAAS